LGLFFDELKVLFVVLGHFAVMISCELADFSSEFFFHFSVVLGEDLKAFFFLPGQCLNL